MARNGSGVHSLPAGNPVVSGTSISSTVHNATMSDISSALTQSLAKDGQTTPTANLPMGGFLHTGVANATARNQYATVDQVQDGDYHVLGSVSGTNTIVGSLSPAITAYSAGMIVVLTPANTNTGATTLNLNSVGALDVLNIDGSACVGGELVAGIPAVLVLDSGADDWIIVNPNVLKSRGREASPRLWTKLITDVSYTLLAADYHKIIEFFGSTAGQTITLPTSVLETGDVVRVWNTSSVTVALTATGNNLFWLTGAAVTGPAARTLAIGAAVDCICDGANWKVAGVGIS